MGFGFRIAPGVRVSAIGGRGLRVGVGPRKARMHLGSGRPGVSTGSGPLTLFRSVPTRRRSPSVPAYERQVRATQRQEQIEAVAALDGALLELCSAHLEEFPPAGPPRAPEPEAVDRRAVRRRLRAEAAEGVSILSPVRWRAVRREAEARLDAAVAEAEEERRRERAAAQEELDRAWERLGGNDPEEVLAVLEAAFEDNEAPAAAVGCEGDRVDVLVRWPPLDAVVGERKMATTPTGRPTHHRRSKTERNELYLAAMASNALAAVREAFAVAPGIGSVALLVVRGEGEPATGHTRLEVLFSGEIERGWLERLNWERIEPAATLRSVPGAEIERRGRTGELQPLPVTDGDDVAALTALAGQLGWRFEPDAGRV